MGRLRTESENALSGSSPDGCIFYRRRVTKWRNLDPQEKRLHSELCYLECAGCVERRVY